MRPLLPLALSMLGCGGGFSPLGDGGPDGGDDGAGQIETLAEGRAGPVAIVVTPPGPPVVVYWAEEGSAPQAQRDGAIRGVRPECAPGCAALLAGNRPAPSGIALSPDGTRLFWSESKDANGDPANGAVWELEIGASLTLELAQGQGAPRRMVAGATALLWVNQTAGEVRREDYPLGMQNGLPIVAGLSAPTGIALVLDQFGNAADIWWTNGGTNGSDGSVWTADARGAGAHSIADNQGLPGGVALDDTSVYWTLSGGVVMRAAHDGSGAAPFASGLAAPREIAVDLDRVYWVEAGHGPAYADGRVQSQRRDGSDLRVIADLRRNPSAIALDSGYVYWTEFGAPTADLFDGGVYRVAKPR